MKNLQSDRKPRTFVAEGDALVRLRVSRGWSVEDLAKKAGLSKRTIQNLEKGKDAFFRTFRAVANAFGVEASQLPVRAVSWRDESPTATTAKARDPISITINVPPELFDECDQLFKFLRIVKAFINGEDDIDVDDLTKGSVILHTSMTTRDGHEFVKAFCRTDLNELGVTEIECPLADDYLNDVVEIAAGYKSQPPKTALQLKSEFEERGRASVQISIFDTTITRLLFEADKQREVICLRIRASSGAGTRNEDAGSGDAAI